MRVTIDLMKKSTQIIDLSDVINPRVGDDNLLLPLHIVYGDNQTDMRGKDVEFLSNDTNGNRIYVAGTCNTNTPGDNLYMGNLTFRFPAGTFKADGTYDPDKTMFRIVDKAMHKVISSVNVKITVMKNAIEFDFDPDKTSYDSRLENMLHDFHDKGQAMLDDIKNLNDQAKSNVSGDTAATAKEAKQQADTNAGDISELKGEVAGARGRFADLPGREDAQDTAINQKESINNANANYAELQQKDAQQDAYIAQKAGKFELEDKLSQISSVPETFANLAALQSTYPNGKPGLFVTADTGHKYIWANGTWTDAGVYQAVGLATNDRQRLDNAIAGNSVLADPSSAPYDDLNTLPVNQVTTYGTDITSIKNVPQNLVTNNGATIVTYSCSSNSTSGAIQVLVTNTGQRAWRACRGNSGSWGDWQTQTFTVQQVFDGATCNAPYNDLNTLPVNSRVVYGSGINHLANIPSELAKSNDGAMQVITEGVNGDKPGSLQTIHLPKTGKTYQRIVWGGDGIWQQWHSYADGEAYLPGKMVTATTGAPYDDLNTFPMNQTITITKNLETIKNIPPLNGASGLTVRSFSWGTDYNGGVQIAIDNNNVMYHRIAWGNKWGAWHSSADGEAYLPGRMVTTTTGAPYDDLNTFPMNQTITITKNLETIKNIPPLNGASGLTVRSFSWGTDYNGGVQIAIDNNNVMYHRIAWGNKWGAWRTEQNDDTNSNEILPSLALFQKVAVIGDSYASGELAFDGNYVDHYPISWLQIMARKDGFTGTNFSGGGMSTRSFLTNKLPVLQNADPQDLYILALGINDAGMENYLGTPADMESGADTFYGNYGKIIKAIQAKAPQAKMVISTIAQDNSIANAYNDAIQQIASHFSIPVIVQNDDPLFKSSFYSRHMQGNHPTGPVYAAMAMAFERLIGQSMIDHLDYWMTYYKDEPKN